jgi:hypothetical protein
MVGEETWEAGECSVLHFHFARTKGQHHLENLSTAIKKVTTSY